MGQEVRWHLTHGSTGRTTDVPGPWGQSRFPQASGLAPAAVGLVYAPTWMYKYNFMLPASLWVS